MTRRKLQNMSSIGQILKKARDEKGFDLEEIHLKIKISSAALKALEEDKIEKIVDFIYAKSFLKQYANFLGLDGQALSKQYSQTHYRKNDFLPLKILERSKKRKLKMPHNTLGIFILIVFTIVIILGIVSLLRKNNKIPFAIPAKSTLATTKNIAAFPIAKDKKLTLTLTATDKVWVKIKSDGKIIIQNILPKNSKENWLADEKFEIWVGKPEVVQLQLNGKPLIMPKNKKIKGMTIIRTGIKF